MIEVEKKFQPTEEQLAKLLALATFLKEEENIDIYYDFSDYSLIKEDKRLRSRNGEWEFKSRLPNLEGSRVALTEEITKEREILDRLNFAKYDNVADMVKNEMVLLCEIKTKRRKYKIDDFHIDLDETDYGFKMCEVELEVDSQADTARAAERILDLVKPFGFEVKPMPGKVMECLKIKTPDLYKKIFG